MIDLPPGEIIKTPSPGPPLEARIAAARMLRPSRRGLHCMHCWGQGREDTIKAIEEAGS
jgi:hypothetical protein